MSENLSHERTNVEKPKKKFPTAIFFILGNEFCERFTFYGLQSLLSLYLTNELLYSETMSTTIFHIWKLLAYFCPVFGAILADSWFGKFRTILYLSILYAFGNILISIGSIPHPLDVMKVLSLTGLLVVSIGTGGIKPCVSAFGGDQYDSDQVEDRKYFFSMFYFLINSGSLLSMLISPLLRAQVKCFGSDSCYPLAYGIPAVLMIIAIIIFVLGKNEYRMRKPEKNVLLMFLACICYAVWQKVKSKKRDKEHWLDYAEDKYDAEFIQDAKQVLRIWFLMTPLPVFWTLFDQTGSRWTFQATKLDGNVGQLNILPEQMQIINPILILSLIPFFDYIIYPCFAKFNLFKQPLQRIICGGMFASLSFLIAGFLEIGVEKYITTTPTRKLSEGSIRSNSSSCVMDLIIFDNDYQNGFLSREMNYSQLDEYLLKLVPIRKETNHKMLKIISLQHPTESRMIPLTISNIKLNTPNNVKRVPEDDYKLWTFVSTPDKISSDKNSSRNSSNFPINFTIYLNSSHFRIRECKDVSANLVPIYIPKSKILSDAVENFKEPEDYTAKINENYLKSAYQLYISQVDEPKTPIPILYQIPQYFILTIGEIMFSISGLDFSYSQAPLSMKSVMQASWLLTVAFGNLITIVVTNARMFDKQSWEFFAFAALMALDIMVFGILAYFYKYVTITEQQNASDKPEE